LPSPAAQQYLGTRKHVFTKTALILHDDLPSIFVLCSAVHDRCFAAIPARTVPEAHSLIAELGAKVDLLIVGDEVPDVEAFSMQLEITNPELIIVQIPANWHEEEVIHAVRTPAVRQSPDATQSARYWMKTLSNVLREKLE
jgi:hypothetical protein